MTILEGIRLFLGCLITITKMPNKKTEKAPYIVYQIIDEFDR